MSTRIPHSTLKSATTHQMVIIDLGDSFQIRTACDDVLVDAGTEIKSLLARSITQIEAYGKEYGADDYSGALEIWLEDALQADIGENHVEG